MIDLNPYLLAPYVDGGRDLATGVDCWALVREFHRREFGVELPAFSGEYDSSENEGMVAQLVAREAKAGTFQRVEIPEPGDVVRLWWTRPNDPSHVGIYLGNSQMLHARRGGVMVDELTDDFFSRRVVDYWRHRSRCEGADSVDAKHDRFLPVGTWRLCVSPNPLSEDFVTVEAPEGTTILEALAAASVRRDRDGGSIRVVLGADVIPPQWWPRIRPRAGTLVSAQSVPGPPLIAFLALYITSFAVSAGIALGSTTIIGLAGIIGTIGAYAIVGGALIGLSYLASSLMAPPSQKGSSGAIGPSESPLAAGTGNQLERWAKVAVGYGTMRVFPHLAAPAWTEIVGGERFWRILLCVGSGRYQIDQTATLGRTGIEVGGVPIEDLIDADAEWEIFEGGGTQTYDTAVLDVQPVDDSPLGYWKLDDVTSPAVNEIAGGVTLGQVGGVTFGGASILEGQASGGSVALDGANDYLAQTTSLPLADLSGDWSAECWVRFSRDAQPSSFATIMSRGNTGDGFGLFVEKAADAFVVNLGGVTANERITAIGPGLKTWHIVVRRKAGSLTAWFNGLSSRVLSTTTPIAPAARFSVGAQYNGAAYVAFFVGSVERVALYDVALSDDEIRLHYDLGSGGTAKPRILVDSVHEVPVNEQIVAFNSGEPEWDTRKWITRKIEFETDELSFEIFFPNGMFRLSHKGSSLSTWVGFQVEYKEDKDDLWTNVGDSTGFQELGPAVYLFSIFTPTTTWGVGTLPQNDWPTATPDGKRAFVGSANNGSAILYGAKWKVGLGTYSMRFRSFTTISVFSRTGGYATAVNVSDYVLLNFRGTKQNARPVRTDSVSLLGVYLPVKETGSTVGQISVIRNRMVKIYDPLDPLADADGMTPERVTNNAAWSYLDWLTNPHVNARPLAISKINLPAIADFATRAKACHIEIDYAGNVWDTSGTILGPSLASIGYSASKWTVVEDRVGKTPRQLITARNGSGWRWVKRFVAVPHGYRVAILDEEDGYQDLEVLVFDDGYKENADDPTDTRTVATEYQTLDARGITNRDAAIEYGKRLLRMLRLRHEEFTAEILFEALVAKRGDLVLANIPTALIGQRAGTIISVEVNGSGLATAVLLDELVTYGVGATYGCRFRIVDPAATTQYLIVQADVTNPATTVSVEQRRLTFSTPIAVVNVPPVGSLIAFGERGEEAQELIVRDIQRRPGFVAAVTLIPYSPQIFNPIDEPAVWDPIVTDPVPLPNLLQPPTPQIVRIDSDENYLAFTATGVEIRMRVLVRYGTGGRVALASVAQARARTAVQMTRVDGTIGTVYGPWIYSAWDESFPALLWIGPCAQTTYLVQARTATAAGVASGWSTPVSHMVIGMSTPPPDVTEVLREGDQIAWVYDDAAVKDLDGFVIRYRYGPQVGSPWSSAHAAHTGVIRGNTFPIGNLPYLAQALTILLKAVDLAGNESVNPAIVTITAAGVGGPNVLMRIDHDAMGWPQSKTNCAVVSGDLAADQEAGDDTQPMWTEDETRMWSADRTTPMWTSKHSKRAVYVAGWIPTAEAIGKRLTLAYAFTPPDANVLIEYREQGPAPMWHADTDAMWTTDAALMWGGYSAWRKWPGELKAPKRKAYQWRVTLYPMRAGRPTLTQFQIISDVDDVRLVINDFVVSAMGSRLPVGSAFREIKAVVLTKQQVVGETAVRLLLGDRQPYGPMVYAYDSSNALVAATIDAEVIGY